MRKVTHYLICLSAIVPIIFCTVLFTIALGSCKQDQEPQKSKRVSDTHPQQTEIAIDSITLPVMDSFPFYDTVPYDQYVDYYTTFERVYKDRPYWLKGEFISYEKGYLVTITQRPHADFLEAIIFPGLKGRHPQYLNETRPYPAKSDPDSLSSKYFELLDPVHALKYYRTTDSLYEVLFYYINKNANVYSRDRPSCHIMLNATKGNYIAVTFDTSGLIIDQEVLFKFEDTSVEYAFAVPSCFTLQIFRREKKFNPKSSYTKYSSDEIKRYYIDLSGKIHDWSGHVSDPLKYCTPARKDSTLGPATTREFNSIPLPLAFEKKLKSHMLRNQDLWLMVEEGNREYDPVKRNSKTFFFQTRLSNQNNTNYYSIHDSEFQDCILILSDKTNNILDTKTISGWLSPHGPLETTGQILSNGQIYLFRNEMKFAPLDYYTVNSTRILSDEKTIPLPPLKYKNLQVYFPYKGIDQFNVNQIDQLDTKPGTFPDSIFRYLEDYINANGGFYFRGENYSINTTSFGITYWILYSRGENGQGINLYVLNRENALMPYPIGLAGTSLESSEDGDVTSNSFGKFLNDSTYLQTYVTCFEDVQCDSIITAYRFLKTGKILIDESLSDFYRRPYDPR